MDREWRDYYLLSPVEGSRHLPTSLAGAHLHQSKVSACYCFPVFLTQFEHVADKELYPCFRRAKKTYRFIRLLSLLRFLFFPVMAASLFYCI